MMKILCASQAKNNEEYKKVLRVRMNFMLVIFLIGVITLLGSVLSDKLFDIRVETYIKGVYSGIGIGLIAAAAFFRFKFKWILSDDSKIKKYRLRDTDERILDINQKAIKVTAAITVFVLYGIVLVAGFFYPILFRLLILFILFILVTYSVAFKIYEKRM